MADLHRTADALQRVNRDILRPLERVGRGYYLAVGAALVVWVAGAAAWGLQIWRGLRVSGLMHPVMWGVYITSFVFWVGIAHSGTLISAILFLFHARWRAAISRAAEAMTVFAVMTAGLFPLIHLGRTWFFYWLIPYPNQRTLWINFRSPLIWDVFAVSTYLTISVVFWYLGLIPDLAALRDRSAGWRRRLFDWLAIKWTGTAREWRHFNGAYLLLAALATPLVVSVHSVVSWDFAMAIVPGWHSTIFAPYFVAGAILSGLAMVLTLMIPARRLLGVEAYITLDHLENVAKLIIVTSLIVGYAYVTEFFFAWYGGNPFERSTFAARASGPYAPLFWLMVACNAIVPLVLFVRAARRNVVVLFVVSLLVNIGMWTERFVIIAGSLSHEFSAYSWGVYTPSIVEWTIFAGSGAWFLFWFLLFIGHVPAIPMAEVKEHLVHGGAEGPSAAS